MQETKTLLRKERLKEKPGKQDFHYDLEKIFEPVTAKQRKVRKTRNNYPKSNYKPLASKPKGLYKHYVILLRQQNRQSKIRQEQYKNVAIFWIKNYKNQLENEYKIMMKLQIVLFSFLRVLVIPTKLILVL